MYEPCSISVCTEPLDILFTSVYAALVTAGLDYCLL